MIILLLFLSLGTLSLAADQDVTKYQLSTETYTVADAPSNLSTIADETIKLISIPNSASYGTNNPDYAIMSVTLKSYYSSSSSDDSSSDDNSSSNSTSDRRKRATDPATDLFTQLLLVNSDLAPISQVRNSFAKLL